MYMNLKLDIKTGAVRSGSKLQWRMNLNYLV